MFLSYNMAASSSIDKLVWNFISYFILVFLNGGSSLLSGAFLKGPWSFALGLPFSLYIKFSLDFHCYLGISSFIAIPSLMYWGAFSRDSIEWFYDAFLELNLHFLKTGCSNIVVGLVYWLVMKLLHHHKWLSSPKFEVTSEKNTLAIKETSSLEIFLLLLKLVGVFFFHGNVLLSSWGFAGMDYSSEVSEAISWFSLGSVMVVWQKAWLQEKLVPAGPAPGVTSVSGAKEKSWNQNVGENNKAICVAEC
ncbi:hypothetical protein O6P43_032899 [Quillaja saponaria]|uniref:Uncharacterized protein n=1 Tax=Quillaja saponaria TaxID=32244 RepID=A0AAD7KNX2_QUISA|nr:hypothetical protein O6P43_032899 [Quillaja saponaria]